MPSGRFPSCRIRPTGSLTAGICARFMARQMMSLRLLALLSRCTSPCRPRASTQFFCRIHMYGARTLCIQVCVLPQSCFFFFLLLFLLLMMMNICRCVFLCVLQLIIVCYGIKFFWRIAGAIIGHFGFGPEYEVYCFYLSQLLVILRG